MADHPVGAVVALLAASWAVNYIWYVEIIENPLTNWGLDPVNFLFALSILTPLVAFVAGVELGVYLSGSKTD